MNTNNYYVYVYIDPRDYSEFYYGKGIRHRKLSHLNDNSDSDKAKTIREIKKIGLDPIIKVIARDLTEEQAFLIEKTLIWKIGKTLTNISSGHFSEKFRPQKTLHRDLFGFDYYNGIYFFNCGDSGKNQRKWEHFKKYGFITAGGHPKYSDPIRTFEIGDIACVYLSKNGYVGVGKILSKAQKSFDVRINDSPLIELGLDEYNRYQVDIENCEYICLIEWIAAVDRKDAFFIKKGKLFSPISVKASMQNQITTINALNEHFQIDIKSYLT